MPTLFSICTLGRRDQTTKSANMVVTRSRSAEALSGGGIRCLLNPLRIEQEAGAAHLPLTVPVHETAASLAPQPTRPPAPAPEPPTTAAPVSKAPAAPPQSSLSSTPSERPRSKKRPCVSGDESTAPKKKASASNTARGVDTKTRPSGGDDKGESTTSVLILEAASARLVWSRVAEVEALKIGLEELGRAIGQVEEVRSRLAAVVDTELAGVLQVAATRLPSQAKEQYDRTFTQYFHALIGHLIPN